LGEKGKDRRNNSQIWERREVEGVTVRAGGVKKGKRE